MKRLGSPPLVRYGTSVPVVYNPSRRHPTNVPALPDVSQWWYLRNLGIVCGIAIGLIFVAFWIFGRLEDNLAESI